LIERARALNIAAMSIIDDLMKVLDRIPIWKRLQDIPNEVDGLRRIAHVQLGDSKPSHALQSMSRR
jgi:hypothetical protein